MLKNIMSVDLEDYYCGLDVSEWSKYPSRLVPSTGLILELFEKYGVKATFFVLGYVADRHPDLIKEIDARGHEVASHGYAHLDITKIAKADFENDLVRSLEAVSRFSSNKILGFRAPYYSIDRRSLWALEILRKHLSYDSSIMPARTGLHGIPDGPRFIYKPSDSNPLIETDNGNFVELPLSTHRIPIIGNIPIAGGFYLRCLPYVYIRHGIRAINKQGKSAVMYIHPRDLDPKMPRLSEYGWHYYYGLNNSVQKFEQLLKDFRFVAIRDILDV